MIAQDIGSAIVGPARADLYFGAGNEAGRVAERIRQSGRFTILLPREIDPTVAGARTPLPPVKALRSEPAPHALHDHALIDRATRGHSPHKCRFRDGADPDVRSDRQGKRQ